MSMGYRSRRMAVDYQIPLITNVKIAKILVEAMSRNYDLNVRNLDFQTSHRTVVLPGLVNVAAFVPGVAQVGSHDFKIVQQGIPRSWLQYDPHHAGRTRHCHHGFEVSQDCST